MSELANTNNQVASLLLSKTDNPFVVAVHDGPHHADDVFCIACLKIINHNILVIRTRNQEQLDKANFQVDVGGKYNPELGFFDHHQVDFNERYPSPNVNKYEIGPKLAAFGLIWRHFGNKVVEHTLNRFNYKYDESCITFIYRQVEKSTVICSDIVDNGEQRSFYIDSGAYRFPSIIKFIQNYNPSPWVESDVTNTIHYFDEAVTIATKYLEREIIKCYSQYMARDQILSLVKNVNEDGLLILEEYLPWSPIFSQFPEEVTHIKMVIFPSSDGWMFQSPYYNYRVDTKFSSVMKNGEHRKWRYPAPQGICGLTNQALVDKTGIPDALFVHMSGFLGTCKTKEGAIAMANYIINHN